MTQCLIGFYFLAFSNKVTCNYKGLDGVYRIWKNGQKAQNKGQKNEEKIEPKKNARIKNNLVLKHKE